MRMSIKKTGAVIMALTMTMGMLSGCGSKVKEVTYNYDANEYIKLDNYKNIEVELEDYTVTDEQLQNTIDQVIEKYVDYKIVDRVAKEGDQVLLSFDAMISGGKVEGFSSSDYKLVIGSGEFVIDGFEEELIGLGAGETRAITGLKVPEDFEQEPGFAGRSITFNIDIQGVYEPTYPIYADDFVTAITNGSFKTVDEYNKELIRMLEENAVTNRYNEKYNDILEVLVNNTTVIKDLPQEYIDSKAEALKKEVEQYTILYDITEEEYLERYYGVKTREESAYNQILLEFIFQYIAKAENITVTEKYYKENIDAVAKDRGYATTEKFLDSFTENGAVSCMILDKVVDMLMESAVEK